MLGIHIGTTHKVIKGKNYNLLHEAVADTVDRLGINACQIFTHNPRTGVETKIDYDAFNKVTANIDVTVHSSYTAVGIWQVNPENAETKESVKRITQFKSQLTSTKKVKARCLVVHIAKRHPDEIAATMKLLKPIIKKSGAVVGLEMVASKADRELTYETPEKLDNLITQIGIGTKHYGIVLDTAHIWAAGVDIRRYDQMADWFARMMFRDKIIAIHLNGSFSVRGSGKDKHAIPFSPDDVIWHGIEPKKSGLFAVCEFAKKYDVPVICEINVGEEKDAIDALETIKGLFDVA